MTTEVDDLHAPGMGPVLGPGEGIGGRLKSQPEDFHVEEIPHLPPPARGEGKYTVATVRSRDWETHRLADELSSRLDVSPDAVHFVGTKDKRAVTTQTVAVPTPESDVQDLDVDGVDVLSTYRSDRTPKIGELKGNRFQIRVRDVTGDTEARMERRVEAIRERGGVPNYFGAQRFGSTRPITHLVGEAVVDGDVLEAALRYAGRPFEAESDDVREARRLVDDGDYRAALEAMPHAFARERRILEALVDDPDDGIAAFRTLSRRLQQLTVYAYQSLLFNRYVRDRIQADLPLDEPVVGDIVCDRTDAGLPDTETLFYVREANLDTVRRRVAEGKAWVTGPVPGTKTPLARGEPGDLEQAILDDEDREPADFHVPEMPDLTAEGVRRPLIVPVGELAWDASKDAIELSFSLPKGSYATCVLREIMA